MASRFEELAEQLSAARDGMALAQENTTSVEQGLGDSLEAVGDWVDGGTIQEIQGINTEVQQLTSTIGQVMDQIDKLVPRLTGLTQGR